MRWDFQRNFERFRDDAASGDQVAVAGMALVTMLAAVFGPWSLGSQADDRARSRT